MAQDFTPSYLRGAVDSSLRRLRTDYIDIYQLHGPSTLCTDDTLQLMVDLMQAGKIRQFGVGLERLDNATSWLQLQPLCSCHSASSIPKPATRCSRLQNERV